MKLSLTAPVLLFASAAAFVPNAALQRSFVAPAVTSRGQQALAMSSEEEESSSSSTTSATPSTTTTTSSSSSSSTGSSGALVPVKEETVEFSAGLLGGIAGLVVGGPWLAAIGAAAANYISKMEGDASDIIRATAKTSIDVFNKLAELDTKYEVLGKAKQSLENALDKLEQQDTVDPEVVNKVETALSKTKEKITEVNDEYDLVGAGMTALGVVGDLVEKAVKKAGELNEEYLLTDKALDSLKKGVDKAKEAAKQD